MAVTDRHLAPGSHGQSQLVEEVGDVAFTAVRLEAASDDPMPGPRLLICREPQRRGFFVVSQRECQ